MSNNRTFLVLFLVVAAVVLVLSISSPNVDCKATTEKIEEEAASGKEIGAGGSESWAGWAKDKLSENLGFKSADDRHSSNTDQLTKNEAGYVKEKACESVEAAKKRAGEAYEKMGGVEDKVEEKVCDVGKKVVEEGKKKAEDTVNWAKEKAEEGYEAAKSKAEETYHESVEDKLSHHQEL